MEQRNYKTIRQLKVNQRAKILEIRANGELGRRIRDMGILPGVELMVVGRAPLKDPVAIKINNFTITLRNNEADYIIVDTNL
ncbi:FeoA family protein [Desulfothermus naphthae]